jgi:hypothetical protein
MSLARREQQALGQIEWELGRSASRMHAGFCAFTQVCSAQSMPRQERIMHRREQLWRAMRQLLAPAVFIAVVMAGGGLDQARHAAKHCSGQTTCP